MNSFPLQRLIRHAYKDGSHSFHYAPVEVDKDDSLVNTHDAVSTNDPADRFTDWPPQPMIAWIESSQD
jgi:hypothetical protein